MVDDLIFQQKIQRHTGCASYLVGSRRTGKCLLVDPLMDTERYEWLLSDYENLKIVGLIDTHTHADHLSGLRYFSQVAPGAEIMMHESAPNSFHFEKLADGDALDDLLEGSFQTKVIYTPGHATDHICLLLSSSKGRKLLSGDSLFIGDVGRTDLGRGDNDLMYDTLFHKLLSLDPKTQVFPAHVGAKHFIATERANTEIGIERDTNPALQVKSREEFVKYMTEGWPPKPENYRDVVQVNLGREPLLVVQEKIVRTSRSA